MFVQVLRSGYGVRLACLGALVICGCGSDPGSSGDSRPTLASTIVQAGSESPYYESSANDGVDTSDGVNLDEGPRAIHGSITGADDVDVYNLGSAEPGDRIIVEMTPDSSLNGAIAIFDDDDSSLLVNDHRNVYLGEKTPFIDIVVRRPTSACYVATASTPGYDSSGDYSLLAYKEPETELPSERPETVLLVFNGGNGVKISSRPRIDIPAFDAANIDSDYAGQTAVMIEQIIDGVREDYDGFNVEILSTSEGDVYDGTMTRVFFGTYDAALLGVSENIDEFNATSDQEAIVFTDTFAAFSPLNPSVSEMAQAIANVTSHEIGHLLGLVHTTDPSGIMDVTASLRDLLADQSFRKAPLHSQVFPLGSQDAIQMLLDTVGGDPLLALMKYIDSPASKQTLAAKRTGPPARAQFHFSGCGCGLHDH